MLRADETEKYYQIVVLPCFPIAAIGELMGSPFVSIRVFFSSRIYKQRPRCHPTSAVIWVTFLLGFCFIGRAETLRLVVAGDGRSDYPWFNKRYDDVSGLNQTITKEIRDAVINEHANILLWTGDIVNVNEEAGPKEEDKTQYLKNGLKAWRDIVMQPLLDSGVKVLPVRGNHEVEWHVKNDPKPREIVDAAAVWTELFKKDVPDNGPPNEKYLSFFYNTDSVLCIGFDQFKGPNETKDRHSINQDWLDKVLAKNKKPFIFAYGHEPAFAAGSPKHTPEASLAAHADRRNRMWKSLGDAGARVYFCGHDHFYDHMQVSRDGTQPGFEMHQFTVGTAGAPFDPSQPYYPAEDWKLQRIKHFDSVNGYLLVTINGDTATVIFKARDLDGQYRTRDRFAYSAKSDR